MLYIKTDAGRGEPPSRALSLTPAQRQVLILCDGERHFKDLIEMMPADTLRTPWTNCATSTCRSRMTMAPRPARAHPVELDEAQRHRAIVEMATYSTSGRLRAFMR